MPRPIVLRFDHETSLQLSHPTVVDLVRTTVQRSAATIPLRPSSSTPGGLPAPQRPSADLELGSIAFKSDPHSARRRVRCVRRRAWETHWTDARLVVREKGSLRVMELHFVRRRFIAQLQQLHVMV
jgi:hypothetical protein